MPETLRDKIRQWYILGIAVFLILGGGYLASLDHQPAALTVASVAQTLPSSRGAFTEGDRNMAEPSGSAATANASPSAPPAAPTEDLPQLAAASPDPHAMMAQHAHSKRSDRLPLLLTRGRLRLM
jgi:hypothetical protein